MCSEPCDLDLDFEPDLERYDDEGDFDLREDGFGLWEERKKEGELYLWEPEEWFGLETLISIRYFEDLFLSKVLSPLFG